MLGYKAPKIYAEECEWYNVENACWNAMRDLPSVYNDNSISFPHTLLHLYDVIWWFRGNYKTLILRIKTVELRMNRI